MGSVIPKKVLEDIRYRNDIVELINSFITVQRSGNTFKALCPFHKEKSPSFHVNQQRQIFHCFGCGAGGDVFKFIMMYESLDFMSAVRMLAEKCGVALEFDNEAGSGVDKNQLFKINTEVAALYRKVLLEWPGAEGAREYLAKRKLSGDMESEFGIGYSPGRGDYIVTLAHKKKYPLEQVELAGLILKGKNNDYYDRFRERLMFPIKDEQGRVIGFSGRSIVADVKAAKYVNTPETPLFHKGRVLYALDKARRNIVDSREAIICEGQIDVIRCHQAGFTTAVAAQGTAFTEDHVRILRRYADSMVLVFDCDEAGQNAAIRASSLFLSAGLTVRVAALPEKQDPDSFIREKGADAFRTVLDKAASVVDFQISFMAGKENIKSEAGVMRITKSVLGTISSSPNAVQREMLIKEAAQRLGVRQDTLMMEMQNVMRRVRPATEEAVGVAEAPAVKPREEIELCEHLVHVAEDRTMADIVSKYLPLKMISDETCRNIIQAALDSVAKGIDIQQLIRGGAGAGEEMESFYAMLAMAPRKVNAAEMPRVSAVKDIILYIWRRNLEEELKALSKDRSSGNIERRHQLLYDIKNLRRWEDGSLVIATHVD